MQARTIRRKLASSAAVTLMGILAISNSGLAQADDERECAASPDVIVKLMDRPDAIAWFQTCSDEGNTAVALKVAGDRTEVIELFRGDAGSG
jgi:hypothetical protein